MKLLRRFFPLLAAVLILAAGFFGIFLLKEMIPDYKDSVRGFERTSGNNRLLYIDDADSLTVFPWNTYNEEKAVPLIGLNPGSDELYYLNDRIYELLSAWSSVFVLPYDSPAEKIMVQDSTCFLKDFPCYDENKEEYLLSLAFLNLEDVIYYYHLVPKNIGEATAEEKSEAYALISEMLDQMDSPNNQLVEYMERLSQQSTVGKILSEIVLGNGQVSKLSYQDEILLVFHPRTRDAAAELDEAENWVNSPNTVILFYHVKAKMFTGFSWQ